MIESKHAEPTSGLLPYWASYGQQLNGFFPVYEDVDREFYNTIRNTISNVFTGPCREIVRALYLMEHYADTGDGSLVEKWCKGVKHSKKSYRFATDKLTGLDFS